MTPIASYTYEELERRLVELQAERNRLEEHRVNVGCWLRWHNMDCGCETPEEWWA